MRIGQILRRYFLPPKLFAELISFEFYEKKCLYWYGILIFMFSASTLLFFLGIFPPFKDSVNRLLETQLKAIFALAGPALQLAIALLSICQSVANWTGQMKENTILCLKTLFCWKKCSPCPQRCYFVLMLWTMYFVWSLG